MKYKVGDLLLIKHCRSNHFQHINGYKHFYHNPVLLNTFGIITAVEFSTSPAVEKINGCIWYSQVEQEQYYFYEDEVIGEVIK